MTAVAANGNGARTRAPERTPRGPCTLLLSAVLVGALVLGGCASPTVTPAPRPTTPAPAPPPPAGGGPAEAGGEAADITRERPSSSGPAPRSGATTALLAESRNERDSGDLSGAAATIERALSIAPEDALLWIELGEIRLEQGNRAAAEEMGRKALTLTGSDSALEARARRLLR